MSDGGTTMVKTMFPVVRGHLSERMVLEHYRTRPALPSDPPGLPRFAPELQPGDFVSLTVSGADDASAQVIAGTIGIVIEATAGRALVAAVNIYGSIVEFAVLPSHVKPAPELGENGTPLP